MKKNVTPLSIHFKHIYYCNYLYGSVEFLQDKLFVVDYNSLTNSNIEIFINYIF
jgi:hypothetical protein